MTPKDIRSTKNRLRRSKQKSVESHETPVGETQAKEVVTDETQAAEPQKSSSQKISYDNAMSYARQHHRLRQLGVPEYYRIPFGCRDILDITMELEHPLASAIEYLYRAGKKPGNDKIKDVRKAVNILERWADAHNENRPTT